LKAIKNTLACRFDLSHKSFRLFDYEVTIDSEKVTMNVTDAFEGIHTHFDRFSMATCPELNTVD
jgi:hypothetical protein